MDQPSSSSSDAGELQCSDEITAVADGDYTKNHNIAKVGEVDLSAYHFTEEESRRVVRKLDLHVSTPNMLSVTSPGMLTPDPQILPFIWCKLRHHQV